MSGLEVVAAVAGIISAFNGSVTLYRSWRDKKQERLENDKNKTLERSLVSGSSTVQSEYDKHFARLGRRFAVGDDRGRAELLEYTVKLQSAIITLMAESNSPFAVVIPSLPLILSTSDETRTGAVSALGEQYQRMLQAKPLFAFNVFGMTRNKEKLSTRKETALAPKEMAIKSRLEAALPVDKSINPNICKGSILRTADQQDIGRYHYRCSSCLLKPVAKDVPAKLFTLVLGEYRESSVMIRAGICAQQLLSWHIAQINPYTEQNSERFIKYGCKICRVKEVFEIHGLNGHLASYHTLDELAGILGAQNVRSCTCKKHVAYQSAYNDHEEWCDARYHVL